MFASSIEAAARVVCSEAMPTRRMMANLFTNPLQNLSARR
jgi:hypothetical protein